MKNNLINPFLTLSLIVSVLTISSCNKDEENDATEYKITVGAYTLEDGNYIDTGNELIFNSNEECQTWSRTAGADLHSADSHLHYNAAASVSYDNSSTTFNWTEFGPEIDQTSIESTCSSGLGGVSKSVNNSTYYQDKPNLYLKITNVVEL